MCWSSGFIRAARVVPRLEGSDRLPQTSLFLGWRCAWAAGSSCSEDSAWMLQLIQRNLFAGWLFGYSAVSWEKPSEARGSLLIFILQAVSSGTEKQARGFNLD